MGEWSKALGEHGEDVVAGLLKLIGWKAFIKNVDISCVRPVAHQQSSSERRNHGIDFVFSNISPLEDDVLKHLCISSKFTSKPYPSSPAATFKHHFNDLAIAIECFKRSAQKKEINLGYKGIQAEVVAGVLFWLNDADAADHDIVLEVENSRGLDDINYGTIYVIDNRRANFLFESIRYMTQRFGADNVQFLYPSTGKNVSPTRRQTTGTVLPPEYLTSGIIPFFVQHGTDKKLAVCCDDEFSEEGLRRLIGYLISVALDFPEQAVIAFPDYSYSQHYRQAELAKASIANKRFAELVEVVSYRSDFRSVA